MKAFFTTLITFVMLSNSYSYGQSEPSLSCYEELLKRGVKSYEEKQFDKAVEYFVTARNCFDAPPDGDLDRWLHKTNDKIKGMIDSVDSLSNLKEGKFRCYNELIREGKRYLDNNEFEKALSNFEASRSCDAIPENDRIDFWILSTYEKQAKNKQDQGLAFKFFLVVIPVLLLITGFLLKRRNKIKEDYSFFKKHIPSEIIADIQELIISGRTKDAIRQILDFLPESKPNYRAELLVHLSALKKLDEDVRMGIVAVEIEKLERNRINVSILKFLEHLKDA